MEAPESRQPDSPFWRFSLRFYALPGVAPACLALQDEAGVDVNLLLFLLFLASERRPVSPADIRRLDSTIAAWRDSVVKPLRALRRRLKGGAEGIPAGASERFRDQIKRAELEAERIEQETLQGFATSFPSESAAEPDSIARRNVDAYASIHGAIPDAPLVTILKVYDSLTHPL